MYFVDNDRQRIQSETESTNSNSQDSFDAVPDPERHVTDYSDHPVNINEDYPPDWTGNISIVLKTAVVKTIVVYKNYRLDRSNR